MKRIPVFMMIIMLCAVLCSCGKGATAKSPSRSENPNDSTSSESQAETSDEAAVIAQSAAEILAYYSELYAAEAVYCDKLNSLKYVLVGEKNLVELWAIDGMNQITVIAKENIERIENQSAAGFNEIRVFDKTNQSISVILDANPAGELLGMINAAN